MVGLKEDWGLVSIPVYPKGIQWAWGQVWVDHSSSSPQTLAGHVLMDLNETGLSR